MPALADPPRPSWRTVAEGGTGRLRAAGVEAPDREVRWIVEQASGAAGPEYLSVLDTSAGVRASEAFDQMIERRAAGEPLQYVLGRWAFRTLDLMVDRRVLIPRPETEAVVTEALVVLDELGGRIAVDLGTGSGAIALSIASERPAVEVWATDASSDALDVARANLAGAGRPAARVHLCEGDWFAALPADLRGRVDLVVTNPPYIAEGEELPPEVVKWEPRAALVAGPTGLEAITAVIEGAGAWLARPGALVVELAPTQAEAAIELARRAGFARVAVRPDLVGRPRALVAVSD